jgi:hypothetical protein
MTFTGSVLALDLATTTGWAFGKPCSELTFGTIRFAKPGASRPVIYRAFRSWLDEMWDMQDKRPDKIVYELPMQPLHMKGKTNIETSKLLIGLAEHLEEWALGKTELREATVGQVRSHFIGLNAKSAIAKPKTMERCHELGWQVETSDEGDACALWDYQISFLRPDIAVKHTPLFQEKRA